MLGLAMKTFLGLEVHSPKHELLRQYLDQLDGGLFLKTCYLPALTELNAPLIPKAVLLSGLYEVLAAVPIAIPIGVICARPVVRDVI
jgi:hypothetical protein